MGHTPSGTLPGRLGLPGFLPVQPAMRQHPTGDPIRVQTDGHGRPLAFRWHGILHRVATIEDVREPALDWWSASGEIRRRYFLVTTQDGAICELYQNLANHDWFLSRLYD